ncbi:MAG TPA: hypothetical protein VFC63_20190 [Blastocatellia bacterium]|nr:hypothetical protein [Blastocatellia bacterium]
MPAFTREDFDSAGEYAIVLILIHTSAKIGCTHFTENKSKRACLDSGK